MGSNAAAKKSQKTVSGQFVKERTTKNKVVFAETGKRQAVGSQYVTKTIAAKLGNPEKIRVTIEAL